MTELTKEKMLAFWYEERNTAYLYKQIAIRYGESPLSVVYSKMADVEEKHADRWAKNYTEQGGVLPAFRPTLRTRILAWMVNRFGPESVLSSLQAGEQNGADAYSNIAGTSGMSAEEKSHSRLINSIASETGKGVSAGMSHSLKAGIKRQVGTHYGRRLWAPMTALSQI
jgi:hypothetical protein